MPMPESSVGNEPVVCPAIEAHVRLLLDRPAALVNYSSHDWHRLPRADIDAVQLATLKRRFADLRDRVPVLRKLADGEGVDRVEQVTDIVPLLFEHTVYKSYPPRCSRKATLRRSTSGSASW